MRPLAGSTVLLTRPLRQAGPLARRLGGLGARVLCVPLIKTVPPPSWAPADRALKRLGAYDALAFTSANAVEAFFARARTGLGRRPARPARLFAVGTATARALAGQGWAAAAVPDRFEGGALARTMGRVRGLRILIPKAQEAREALPAALRRAGARLDMPTVYRTVPDPRGTAALRAGAADRADWVVLMSPSAVSQLFKALGEKRARELLSKARGASIGPVTSAALRARGAEPAVEASLSTAEGLCKAMCRRAAPVPEKRLAACVEAALRAAGRHMRAGFLTAKVSYKGRANPVTEADLAAEQAILDTILGRFPDHDFLTEERAPRASGSEYVWVIDPIDGTLNFAHGYPHCCASVAVTRRGTVVAGGVYDPFRDELFTAVKGKGSFLNGRRIRVGAARRLEDALLITGFAYDRHQKAALYTGFVRRFLERAQDLRRSGSAALDLAWVAAGRLDGFWEFHLNPWDVAAGRLLVEEAGGKVTDFAGRPWGELKTWGRRTLATNSRIHREMASVLRDRRR
ncbi:MAG: uroporphyrinogen-III synthase [Elusimicrobia bacterium]|nr:uroporphyrinogen-III synthase [Elusimicrobiota bacterium]